MEMTVNELEQFKQSILDSVRVMMQTTGQVTQYIGARYVPLFAEPFEWSDQKEYEPLTIVTHQGNSFTSRQFVPKGVPITNEMFWATTGNYNAQIEQYRQEVAQLDERITNAQNTVVGKAPIKHDSADQTYGVGSDSNYGHVKLSDVASGDGAETATAATPKMVKNAVDFKLGYIACNIINHKLIVSYSSDLVNFTKISEHDETNNNDWVTLYLKDDIYYIFSNYGYYTTKDFLSFNYHAHNLNDWGGTVIEDKYIAAEMYDGSHRKLYIYDMQFDGENITFNNKRDVTTPLFSQGTSFVIDPSAITANGIYYLAFKDETTKKVKVYSYNSLDDLISGNYTQEGKTDIYSYIEGPKLFSDGSKINCLISFYDMANYFKTISGVENRSLVNARNLPMIFLDVFGQTQTVIQCNISENRHIDFECVNDNVACANILVEKPQPNYWEIIRYAPGENANITGNIPDNIIIEIFKTATINLSKAIGSVFNVLINTDASSESFKVNGNGFASNIRNVELLKFNSAGTNDYSVPAGSLIRFHNMGVYFKEN